MAPATPGLVLTAAATILLLFASINTPILKSLYFFKATLSTGEELTLGTLGYCAVVSGTQTCSSPSVGYELDLNTIFNVTAITIPTIASKWITYILVLHIVALGASAIACVFGILAHCQEFASTCISICFSSMAAGVAMVAFIFDIILFVLARSRLNSISGASSSLGNSVWIVLAGWLCLLFSGCAFGCGRRCIAARGPRDAEGRRGKSIAPDTAYADQARNEAIRLEEERKARAVATQKPNSLPGFQPYETQPLTGGGRGQPDQWLDEDEDPSLAHSQQYHDQNALYPASETSSFARGGYNAGIGAGMGPGRTPSGHAPGAYGYQGALQRSPSDQFYAPGQATPGGYPPVQEDPAYYQNTPYDDPYNPPQQTYYPQTQTYASDPIPAAATAGWTPPADLYTHQEQGYGQPRAASSDPYASHAGPDPRQAMQHGFVSPSNYTQRQSPSPNPQDAYGGYTARTPEPSSYYQPQSLPQPQSGSSHIYAPQPQHPASLQPSQPTLYGSSSQPQAVAADQAGPSTATRANEPPSYELTAINGGQQQGYRPDTKASYYPPPGR